ncbi:MAG: hypothetical protein M1831_005606 [Alyxoria varia]|nr:MAG: hypothetical protein M1831_005606 [Alyxoria varia]
MPQRTSKSQSSSIQHSAGILSDRSLDGPEIGTLVVVVDRAKNLPNHRTMGKQDPYCACRLGKEAKKTETDRRGGQTPRWTQHLRFTVHDSLDYTKVKLSIFDEDKKTDLIGETWIEIKDVLTRGGGQAEGWHELSAKGRYAGQVRVELTYQDSRPPEDAAQPTQQDIQQTPTGNTSAQGSSRGRLGPRSQPAVKRRPLPNPEQNSSPGPSSQDDPYSSQIPPSASQPPQSHEQYAQLYQDVAQDSPYGHHELRPRSSFCADDFREGPYSSEYNTTAPAAAGSNEPPNFAHSNGYRESQYDSYDDPLEPYYAELDGPEDQFAMQYADDPYALEAAQAFQNESEQHIMDPQSPPRQNHVELYSQSSPTRPSLSSAPPHTHSAPVLAHHDPRYGKQAIASQEGALAYEPYRPHRGSQGYDDRTSMVEQDLPRREPYPSQAKSGPPPPPVHRRSAPTLHQNYDSAPLQRIAPLRTGPNHSNRPSPRNNARPSPHHAQTFAPQASATPNNPPPLNNVRPSPHHAQTSVPQTGTPPSHASQQRRAMQPPQHANPLAQQTPSPSYHRSRHSQPTLYEDPAMSLERERRRSDDPSHFQNPPISQESGSYDQPRGRHLAKLGSSPAASSQQAPPPMQTPPRRGTWPEGDSPNAAYPPLQGFKRHAAQGNPPVARPRPVSPKSESQTTTSPGFNVPRKSVSPQPQAGPPPPADDASNPFSPDSFNTYNPQTQNRTPARRSPFDPAGPSPMYAQQQVSNRQGQQTSQGSQQSTPPPAQPEPEQNDATNPDGPIRGPNGKLVDPTDHLPTSTYAPEPERKGADRNRPTIVANVKQRFGPREASRPLPPPTAGRTISATPTTFAKASTPPSSSDRPPLYQQNTAPPAMALQQQTPSPPISTSAGSSPGVGGRNRLQKRHTPATSSPLAPSPPTALNSGYSQQQSQRPPPIPSKIPLDPRDKINPSGGEYEPAPPPVRGQHQHQHQPGPGYQIRPGEQAPSASALSREMASIDIGPSPGYNDTRYGGNAGGRLRRSRFGA